MLIENAPAQGEVDPATTQTQGTAADATLEAQAQKTFTQEDINRIATKESAKAERALLKKLGIDNLEEHLKAKSMPDQSPENSDLQAALQKVADAEAKAQRAELKSTLLESGIRHEFTDYATFAMQSADLDAEEFKAANPQFFCDVGVKRAATAPALAGQTTEEDKIFTAVRKGAGL